MKRVYIYFVGTEDPVELDPTYETITYTAYGVHVTYTGHYRHVYPWHVINRIEEHAT